MVSRRTLAALLSAALLLPVAVLLLAGVGQLLAALGDSGGRTLLWRLTALVTAAWGVDLVALIVVLGIEAAMRGAEAELREGRTSSDPDGEPLESGDG